MIKAKLRMFLSRYTYTTPPCVAKSSTYECTTSCQSFHNYSILKYIKIII